MADQNEVRLKFEEALNKHGYGFQYAVVNLAEQLFHSRTSIWGLEATEFPVEVQGHGTRVDIVLTHGRKPLYMVAECKRANPSHANWCFARSPHVLSNGASTNVVLEQAQRVPDTSDPLRGKKTHAAAQTVYVSEPLYHVGVDVKIQSHEKGDAQGTGRGAIEEAATQIIRGLNGIVEFLGSHPQLFEYTPTINVLPVIFTTASLWTSEINLGTADLATGKVDLNTAPFTKRDWLLYQYHTSPGLKHSYPPPAWHGSMSLYGALGVFLQRDYIRTIPIVSPAGIADFLQWSSELDVRQ